MDAFVLSVSQITLQMQEQREQLIHTAEYYSVNQLAEQGMPVGVLVTNCPKGMGSTDVIITLVHSRVELEVRACVGASDHVW